ncbi:MAG TPA: STAS domain-containing protein [Jiangellales bacterium]|nr:STAS domain-containing protein [Jiangellales bacterium]
MITRRTPDHGAPVEVHAVDGWVVVRVRGEVDLALEPALLAAHDQVVAYEEPHVYVDVTEVDFLDSSGVAALAHLQRRARAREGYFVLSPAEPIVERVLDLTGLADAADDPDLVPLSLRDRRG